MVLLNTLDFSNKKVVFIKLKCVCARIWKWFRCVYRRQRKRANILNWSVFDFSGLFLPSYGLEETWLSNHMYTSQHRWTLTSSFACMYLLHSRWSVNNTITCYFVDRFLEQNWKPSRRMTLWYRLSLVLWCIRFRLCGWLGLDIFDLVALKKIVWL